MSPVKKITFSAIAGALAILSLVIVFKENGLLDFWERKDELAGILSENEKLKEQNKELFNEVKRLKSDEVYIEYMARKELGVIKKDEYLIQFPSDKKE